MRRLAVLLLLLAMLSGCGGSPQAADPVSEQLTGTQAVTFTDDLGRTVTTPPPRRVAAMIGSFADVWCLAGGRETLVAAANDAWTSFSLGLDDSVQNLGAVKEPNLELLLASEPDLILASCNTASNLELLETWEQAGIPVACFDIQTFSDYLNMLEICTRLTGCPERYETYGLAVQDQVEAAICRQNEDHPTILCLRATGSSCKVKGSEDNVLGEMLADLGCANVADTDGALLENLSLEAIIAADPDYIFAVLQGSDPTDARQTLETTLLSNPAWAQLTAVREGRFYTLDHALYNLKPNARWGEAYEKLADILYP